MNQLIEGYDRALLELEANRNIDLSKFEEEYVWKFVPGAGAAIPDHLQLAAARYVLGTEILRPSPPAVRRARLHALLYPFEHFRPYIRQYHRAIELTIQGRLPLERAFQITEEAYLLAAADYQRTFSR